MPADCFPSPFLCYKPVEGIMTPTMRSYKPRVRLMGNGKYSRAISVLAPMSTVLLYQQVYIYTANRCYVDHGIRHQWMKIALTSTTTNISRMYKYLTCPGFSLEPLSGYLALKS